jgi:peptidoglycan/xylan/chitin deacetylase (PgdA/CDA1 family)
MKSKIICLGLEALYFSGAYRMLRPLTGGVGAILMLHHVRPPRRSAFQPNKLLEVAPDFLEQTLKGLHADGQDIVSLDEMHRRLTAREFSRRFVCITFDDGYRDNKEWAYPILKAHGAPFAIYVPTAFPERSAKLWWLALERAIAENDAIELAVDGVERMFQCRDDRAKKRLYNELYWLLRRRRDEASMHAIVDDLCARYRIDLAPMAERLCMNWDEITELAGDPLVTIGAHTVNHAMLSKASDEAVRREVEEGRRILETRLGRPVQHLAYPYGGRDLAGSREFAVARELGFKTAVTTRPGVLFPGHAAHLTALPRISLNGEYEQERFVKVLLSGAATALFNAFRKVDAV